MERLSSRAVGSSNFPIRRISIHATDTLAGHELSMSNLEAMHRARGWTTVGYHYLIHLDGKIELTPRPVTTIPAAVKGWNKGMIAVAYVGGKLSSGRHVDTRTQAQKLAIGHLVNLLAHKYGVPAGEIRGHRDWDYIDKNHDGTDEPDEWLKQCPCFEVKDEVAGWLKG